MKPPSKTSLFITSTIAVAVTVTTSVAVTFSAWAITPAHAAPAQSVPRYAPEVKPTQASKHNPATRTVAQEIDGLRHKGWALKYQGKYAEAEDLQRRALALVKADDFYTKASIYMDISECLRIQKRFADALVVADEANIYLNGCKDVARSRCMNDLGRAKCLVMEKKYRQAEAVLTGVINKSKNDPSKQYHFESLDTYGVSEAHMLLGICYSGDGSNKQAEASFQQAIALSTDVVPENSPARLEALEEYLKFLTKNKTSSDAEKIAARIANIKKNPSISMPCGTAMAETQRWLMWEPSSTIGKLGTSSK